MTRLPNEYAGGHRSRVTPVPIPNTEVKPATADGTAWETVWESRSLPAVIHEEPDDPDVGLLICTAATGATAWERAPAARAERAGARQRHPPPEVELNAELDHPPVQNRRRPLPDREV